MSKFFKRWFPEPAPAMPRPRGRLPVIYTIALPGGRSFEVVREDIMDGALRRPNKHAA